MDRESALTPLLLQAFDIYKYTYGFVPPVFADISVTKNGNVTLKILSWKHEKLKLVNSIVFVSIGLLLCSGISFTILKKFFTPNTTSLSILEIAVLVLFFTFGVMTLGSLFSYIKSRSALPHIILFIQEGLRLGKLISHKLHDINEYFKKN